MSRPIRLFIPEWVPLANKGETAIVYGIADGLFPGEPVEITALERNMAEPVFREGIRFWPHRWFYAPWRNRPFSLSLAPKDAFNSGMSLLRHGLELFDGWVRRPPSPVRNCARILARLDEGGRADDSAFAKAMRSLREMDHVVVGHDGVLSHNEECHVIRMLSGAGFSYGVFGTCMPLPLRTRHVHRLYAEMFAEAKYVFTRNPEGPAWAGEQFPGLGVESAPDPAFAMRPASEDEVDALIGREKLGSFFERPVIMMTVVENDVTLRFGFRKRLTAQGKARRHVRLAAQLVRAMVKELDANILFLPHCIGPTRLGDDRRVARAIMAAASAPADRVRLIEREYDARKLKGLMARADLLVAERIHSIIGAVGVHTPFVCLGSMADNRCTGIVGALCGAEDLIYSLDEPDEASLFAHVKDVWRRRGDVRERIEEADRRIRRQLAVACRSIRARMKKGRSGARENAPRGAP